MAQNLLLTVRLHGDGQGTARYHGMAQGGPEWPPSPARIFQALVAGSARGNTVSDRVVQALQWLEGLTPPVIVAPAVDRGGRVSLFVPNNDADAVNDPRDVGEIRTKKLVEPSLLDEGSPLLYAWTVPRDSSHANTIVEAANDLYQLGRGVDMAWALGEIIDDGALDDRMREHNGAIHRPQVHKSGKSLACPIVGSLASLVGRHQAAKLRVEGKGKSAKIFFTNPAKPRFLHVSYAPDQQRALFELRDQEQDTKTWPWPLHRVTRLIEALRNSAAERLRVGLPTEHDAIERALIGRKADGSDSSPVEQRVRIIPLPSIGHEHADRAIRRILLQTPSGAALPAEDIEWAFSGLESFSPVTGVIGPFVLVRSETDDMLRHYLGPSRRWRSVTAIVLPESARRRRIEPKRRREQAKSATERTEEERLAVTAVHVALRQARVSATAVAVRVQREPFEAKGARVEAFAEGTRFAKERLWHVEVELDRQIDGPLVVGDGRFLGLGVMAPVNESSIERSLVALEQTAHPAPVVAPPGYRGGLFGLTLVGNSKNDAGALARALRRAVMARVQIEIGRAVLGGFFTGHEPNGEPIRTEHANHLAFQWDPPRQRLLVVAPHWLDRREPSRKERDAIVVLERALESIFELRAGCAGRFEVRLTSVAADDSLLRTARSWRSLTPYAVTRHKKRSSAAEALIEDALGECRRRSLPTPSVTVLDARGVPGAGLEGHLRLDFAVGVTGPIVLGRSRYLGGGLFAPVPDGSPQ